MKFRRLNALAVTLATVGVLHLAACDPKLTGTEDTNDNGDGGNGGGTDPVVTTEALIVGQILTFHAQLLQESVGVAEHFDPNWNGFAGRSFPSSCATVTEQDAGIPQWTVDFTGCTDASGTVYTGGGLYEPSQLVDGYTFHPSLDDDLIRASNPTNDDYNHTLDVIGTGTVGFTFSRDQAQAVSAVTVSEFLRHIVRDEQVTFSFQSVTFTGTIGQFGNWADAGSVVRVVWDGVGLFDAVYGAGGSVNYTMQGANYTVNLADGVVTVAGV